MTQVAKAPGREEEVAIGMVQKTLKALLDMMRYWWVVLVERSRRRLEKQIQSSEERSHKR